MHTTGRSVPMPQLQLAIECSGLGGEVAVCDRAMVLRQMRLPEGVGTVQTLAPAIADLLADQQPEFIGLTAGPGSFTGLRVGLATAKLLAYAWGCPLAAVDTLEVIARQTAAALGAPPWGRLDDPVAVQPMGTHPGGLGEAATPPPEIKPGLGQQPEAGQLPGTQDEESARPCGGPRAQANAAPASGTSAVEEGAWVIVPVLNAFRCQVFTAAWACSAQGWQRVAPSQVVSAERFLADPLGTLFGGEAAVHGDSDLPAVSGASTRSIRAGTARTGCAFGSTGAGRAWGQAGSAAGPHVVLTGPGLKTYAVSPESPWMVAPQVLWTPTARVVGEIGWDRYRAGQVETALSLRPNYLRGSAAEERARAK
ncbi:MAG: tRNA (adenosine(37)-N6)-threonylcarbamoyltransferase complex dimerization subunit type 1 TsaB [Planctomycetota bacterium]|nr:MAG: tRNA (adenosine(37)-N6)-threonylcarbamoyltransferase complex dimerization subunit type 1 TsaB [Planctomycetota bacterium]